jgi:hypothetical protein
MIVTSKTEGIKFSFLEVPFHGLPICLWIKEIQSGFIAWESAKCIHPLQLYTVSALNESFHIAESHVLSIVSCYNIDRYIIILYCKVILAGQEQRYIERLWIFRSDEWRLISWAAERLLACQNGFCFEVLMSMKFILNEEVFPET